MATEAKTIVGTWNEATQSFDIPNCYLDGGKCTNEVVRDINVKGVRRNICQEHHDELMLVLRFA